MDASSRWKCWFPSYFLRFVSSPVYIINSDIDPTALVIGQQLDNYSNTNWMCVNGIAQARGSKPFCSAATSAAAAVNAGPATGAAGAASRAVGGAGAAAASSVGRAERSLRSVARRRGDGGRRSDGSVDDGSSIDDSGAVDGSQPDSSAGKKPTTSASCPGGSETAVDTYGQQVCRSINDLMGKRSNLAAFVVGRPLHAITIFNTWGAVSVNGQSLKDTIGAWWKGRDAVSFSVVPA